MIDKLAAIIDLGPKGGFQGFGNLGLENRNAYDAPAIFASAMSTTIGVISVVAIIWFLVQLLTGAVAIIGSGGDKAKNEQARAKITSGLTGLIVVIAGVFITDLVGTIFGFPILDIANSILNLKIK